MFYLNSFVALLVATIALNLFKPGLSTNYCSKELCPQPNEKHIRCGNNGSFGVKCPKNAKAIEMSENLQNEILKKHNDIRNMIANGTFKGLEAANRMTEISWEKELAENALFTAKTCVYAHDQCRNTPTYFTVGQNIAWYSKKAAAKLDYVTIIGKIIQSWLRQADTVANMVGKFNAKSGEKVDDFAQMIQASCGHIGCAMVHFETNNTHNVFLVCNYSTANIQNEPIYQIGPACSACLSGCSESSPGLCNTEEESHYLLKLKLLKLVNVKVGDVLGLKHALG